MSRVLSAINLEVVGNITAKLDSSFQISDWIGSNEEVTAQLPGMMHVHPVHKSTQVCFQTTQFLTFIQGRQDDEEPCAPLHCPTYLTASSCYQQKNSRCKPTRRLKRTDGANERPRGATTRRGPAPPPRLPPRPPPPPPPAPTRATASTCCSCRSEQPCRAIPARCCSSWPASSHATVSVPRSSPPATLPSSPLRPRPAPSASPPFQTASMTPAMPSRLR